MRTKTLFIAAAAIAAGLASSQAQLSNVYSVNVVGYINVPLTTQKTLLSNPLDNGTNTLISIDNGVLPNATAVSVWAGTGFNSTTKSRGTWGSNLSIPAGSGFFVTAGGACTLTFVGSAPTSNNYALTATKALVGAILPMAGTLTNASDNGANTLNIGNSLPNAAAISTWNGAGFNSVTKSRGAWSDQLTFPVGGGFFVTPGAAVTWKQYLQ